MRFYVKKKKYNISRKFVPRFDKTWYHFFLQKSHFHAKHIVKAVVKNALLFKQSRKRL
jgi:hypothetical protein